MINENPRDADRVTQDPAILVGTPNVTGTRVPVAVVIESPWHLGGTRHIP